MPLLRSGPVKRQGSAVALQPGVFRHHTGIVFFDELDAEFKHIHLAFHGDFRYEAFDGSSVHHVVAETTVPEDDIIATICRKIAREHSSAGLPYAISYSAKVARNGDVILTSEGDGFTCSTFVLAVFAGAGLDLVDDEGWPLRAEDAQVQQGAVDLLTGKASLDHIEAQVRQIGVAKRLQPTEVAAAASIAASCPNPFSIIEPISRTIEGEFDAAEARRAR